MVGGTLFVEKKYELINRKVLRTYPAGKKNTNRRKLDTLPPATLQKERQTKKKENWRCLDAVGIGWKETPTRKKVGNLFWKQYEQPRS